MSNHNEISKEEAELERYLEQQDGLSFMHRQASSEQPPEELDARILAAARAGVADEGVFQSGTEKPRRRMSPAIYSLAAGLMAVAVGLSVFLDFEAKQDMRSPITVPGDTDLNPQDNITRQRIIDVPATGASGNTRAEGFSPASDAVIVGSRLVLPANPQGDQQSDQAGAESGALPKSANAAEGLQGFVEIDPRVLSPGQPDASRATLDSRRGDQTLDEILVRVEQGSLNQGQSSRPPPEARSAGTLSGQREPPQAVPAGTLRENTEPRNLDRLLDQIADTAYRSNQQSWLLEIRRLEQEGLQEEADAEREIFSQTYFDADVNALLEALPGN